MHRRTFLGTTGVVFVSGCLGGGAEESGTVREPNDVLHNIDVSEGDTIRVEVDNEEGFNTLVDILSPDDDAVVEGVEVETEDTITHTAEQTGVYRVFILPAGRASYEIHIDDGD